MSRTLLTNSAIVSAEGGATARERIEEIEIDAFGRHGRVLTTSTDGAGPGRWLADIFRRDGRGLALGALVVFLITFNNTTCFDLAQIFSFGNELRAKSVLGATAAGVLTASLPAIGLAGTGAVIVWIGLNTTLHAAMIEGGESIAFLVRGFFYSCLLSIPIWCGFAVGSVRLWLRRA